MAGRGRRRNRGTNRDREIESLRPFDERFAELESELNRELALLRRRFAVRSAQLSVERAEAILRIGGEKRFIKGMWVRAMQCQEAFHDILDPDAVDVFNYLIDVRRIPPREGSIDIGVRYAFAENPFFSNKNIDVWHTMRQEDAFLDAVCIGVQGTDIDWKGDLPRTLMEDHEIILANIVGDITTMLSFLSPALILHKDPDVQRSGFGWEGDEREIAEMEEDIEDMRGYFVDVALQLVTEISPQLVGCFKGEVELSEIASPFDDMDDESYLEDMFGGGFNPDAVDVELARATLGLPLHGSDVDDEYLDELGIDVDALIDAGERDDDDDDYDEEGFDEGDLDDDANDPDVEAPPQCQQQ